MADWQAALQSLFIGVVFAYMCGRLFTLISSIREQKFRVERGVTDASAAPLLSTFDEQEFARADEINVSYSELDADDGGDELERHGYDSSTSSSEFNDEVDRSRDFLISDATKIASGDDEGNPRDIVEDVTPDLKLDDRVAISGRDSLKILTNEEPEDEGKESEGNETDDWEGVESTELEELFGAASTYVATMVSIPGVKPSSEAMLQLYAYYKIATEGPCSTSQPSAFQPTARAKWNAWQKLGNLPQEEAMQNYVGVLTSISPTWHQSQEKKKDSHKELGEFGESSSQPGSKKMGPGPVFSSLVMNEDGSEGASTLDPLHACARDGDVEGLTKLLDQDNFINVKDSEGRTPLIWAVDRGSLSAVEILVAKGAEINAKDQEGQTALHYATVCDQEEVAKYLFEHGADISIPDNDGNTPLSQCPPHWLWLQRATG